MPKNNKSGTAFPFSKNGMDFYKEYNCDLCGSTNAVEIPHVRDYTNGQVIHICRKCGLIYVKCRRSSDRVAEVWSNELFAKRYTSKSPLMFARHNYVAEFIDQSLGLKNKKVCDVGAGEGQFLKIIKNNYKVRTFGIEPSRNNCRLMKKENLKAFNGTLQNFIEERNHKKNLFDIVTMLWSIENSTSPKELLLGARKIMRDNGYLVIATGSRILVPFSKPLYLYLSTNPADTHPVRFSVNTLIAFLETCGFRAVRINPFLNDNLLLCVIAKKEKLPVDVRVKGNNFRKVKDFFERWHKETRKYYPAREYRLIKNYAWLKSF